MGPWEIHLPTFKTFHIKETEKICSCIKYKEKIVCVSNTPKRHICKQNDIAYGLPNSVARLQV